MTNLSDLFPAGAGKQVSFVADGSISAAWGACHPDSGG